MNDFFVRLWKEEDGIETVEWIFIAAVILAVAAGAYAGGLGDAITGVITDISTALGTAGDAIVTPPE